MLRVSKRVRHVGAVLALFTILSAHTALAAPRGDDGDIGWRGALQRVKQLIVKALDDCRLGLPPG
jgi:hypothetical protein